MIILALDALDLNLVRKFQCKTLMQKEHGQTDISNFNLARTIVLWASFLTGRNMEIKIPVKTQWEFKLSIDETFLKFYNSHKAIDVPAFSYKQKNHAEERRLLKNYFHDKATIKDHDAAIWKYHKENKKEFLDSMGKFDLIMGYFNLADSIGHLSFGISEKMKDVYQELEKLAKDVENSDDFILVISDHGMKAIGRYGDHTKNGFYSANRTLALELPKITDFYNLVRLAKNESA
jgi:hypothetical protein